ncbi:MAG: hypothetical protein M3423_08770 [Actinomycetota bacterium]|nr:hypothetical protein [Actinomycetota bacterium]
MFVADAGTDVPKIHSVTDDGRVINVVDDAEPSAPSYLPNGDLLFVRDVEPAPRPGLPQRGAIWTMNADGSDQRQLLPVGQAEGWTLVEQAIASPGGEWVAFSGIVDDSANSPRIYIVRSDGSQLRQVSGLDDPGIVFDEEVAWSSDGSALAFIRQAPRGEAYYFELWVVDVEDTVDSQLLFGTSTALTNVSWGPGERILASEARRDGTVLVRVDPQTGEHEDVLTDAYSAAVSADGTQYSYWDLPPEGDYTPPRLITTSVAEGGETAITVDTELIPYDGLALPPCQREGSR